ncbi:zinc finger BED domain-containing protein RICESLEEPER 2-like [Rhizophagus irregularis DAOM 181602=DAOM 197198]|nr:zinc finger BED domain-containing protein RICESLEEPER 2-like [Rhizophagus irregularis DAOM 181602=DAOM 197198]
MNGKTCDSTGNLSRHLKSHMDKIDPSTKKQADFMKNDEIFREKLAIWITIDDQPFTITECQEFKELFKNVLGKLSFTLNCWISTNNIAFFDITYHFVDIDWCLKETLVDFIHLSSSHFGENLAKEFLKSIDEDFNILTKIMTITADNTANNNTFLRELEYVCHQKEPGDAQEEDELLELVSQEEQEDNVNENFARRCEFFSIQSLNVMLDVKTRWNSTYLMLDRILKLQEPINDLTLLEPDLNKFFISTEEWNIIKELHRVLEKFYRTTEYMSISKYVTLLSSVPIYNKLLDHIESLLDKEDLKYCEISNIRDAI